MSSVRRILQYTNTSRLNLFTHRAGCNDPFVQWTNGHCRILNTSVSYPRRVMLDRITSLQQFWHCKRKMSIGQTEMSIGHSYVHSSSGRTEMSIGHKYMSIRPLDEQKCSLDIQMSIRPLDEWTNGHCLMATTLVSYPHGVRLSQITSLQLPCTVNVTCPLDINKCPFVHWKSEMSIGHSYVRSSIGRTEMSIGHSNVHSFSGRTQMSIGHSNVHSSNGRTEMSIGHSNVHSSIGQTEMSIGHSNVHSSSGPTEMSIGHKYMSIRPLDKQKCPLDIQMSICPVDEQKCPLDIQMSIRPLDEWTNGHCLMASTLVSYPHGVRLSQITSLQLTWHCKRYMFIGHK